VVFPDTEIFFPATTEEVIRFMEIAFEAACAGAAMSEMVITTARAAAVFLKLILMAQRKSQLLACAT